MSSLTNERADPEYLFEQFPQIQQQIARQLGRLDRTGRTEGQAALPNGRSSPDQREQAAAGEGPAIHDGQQAAAAAATPAGTDLEQIVRGVYSERQLQEVMTDFWFNHFNVYWDKGADRWLTTDFEMNVIRPRVFGKFKDLLLATAQSPGDALLSGQPLSSSPTAGSEAALSGNAQTMPTKRAAGHQ